MLIIHQKLSCSDATLVSVPVRVERMKLVKRVWRGTADDGAEFGIEVQAPLRDGDVLFQTASSRYVIQQIAEPLLEIDLSMAPSAAAGIGWAVGNLHLELMAEATRLLTPDEKAARQLLDRIGVAFRETTAVFRPGRFARGSTANVSGGSTTQELGASHKH